MFVYEGATWYNLWYKHLFYILYVKPTYVQVDGISTFSDADVGLVPVKFTGSYTLYLLAPA